MCLAVAGTDRGLSHLRSRDFFVSGAGPWPPDSLVIHSLRAFRPFSSFYRAASAGIAAVGLAANRSGRRADERTGFPGGGGGGTRAAPSPGPLSWLLRRCGRGAGSFTWARGAAGGWGCWMPPNAHPRFEATQRRCRGSSPVARPQCFAHRKALKMMRRAGLGQSMSQMLASETSYSASLREERRLSSTARSNAPPSAGPGPSFSAAFSLSHRNRRWMLSSGRSLALK